jgi:4-hydroxy-2-oxoheptanedioate aldolase
MRENGLRALWARGERSVNCWLTSSSLHGVDQIARLGYDSLLFDMQHSSYDYKDIYTMLVAVGARDVTPLVRVPWLDQSMIMRVLDAGAAGVMCPIVDTKAQAEEFVAACRYPPAGVRSWGPWRASLDGGTADYHEHANDSVIAIAQIESVTAVENLEEIVGVPGLDALFVGPADLSLSGGGAPGMNYQDALVVEQHQRIVEVAHGAGLKVGVLTGALENVPLLLDWGIDMISVANDSQLLVAGARNALEVAREALASLQRGADLG